ncbi:hypothetical protein [Nesterenkonia xinjiangensis]|uniref:Secreted protein n=1 Tax=Nesterenkonia xinjiangensis TaxID=225327 RepID=A0A7Z0GKC5_9MICC|nr:hypothetical protein [Nesterenkonia xinjiangensis]NYJ76711.1 hypothetical protein [Nesterenkonia xinjiangensis]
MRRRLAMALGSAALLAAATVGPADATGQADLAQVRSATAAYHDLGTAMDAGYAQVSDCVPNMGYHYQRGVAATAEDLDPLNPEILVYAPLPNGRNKLVAVEYATWDEEAELFGTAFDPPHPHGGPPFHTLHVWVWQGNPDGIFAPTNPNVRC